MSVFWNNFVHLCENCRKSPNKVAAELGISSGIITKWKQGSMPTLKSLIKVSGYFNTTPDVLVSNGYGDGKRIPVLGKISCGSPIVADQQWEDYCVLPDGLNADFCLVAKGDSMIGARIYDGDRVYVKESPVVENGNIAAVIIGEETTLKRVFWYPDEEKLILIAENPKYLPMIYSGHQLEGVRILGKAVGFTGNII